MSKLDIINEVATKAGITKTKAETVVETVFESMKRALGDGERIELRGFSILRTKPKNAKSTLPPLPKLHTRATLTRKNCAVLLLKLPWKQQGGQNTPTNTC